MTKQLPPLCQNYIQKSHRKRDNPQKNLILSLPEAIQLPKKVAVCKSAAHTKKDDPISKADAAAEEAATTEIMSLDKTPTYVDQEVLKDMQNVSPQAGKQKWLNKGAKQENGVYM